MRMRSVSVDSTGIGCGGYGACASAAATSTASIAKASIMDVASGAGLLALNPSDLVFESSQNGIAYYDFVLSVTELDVAASPKRHPGSSTALSSGVSSAYSSTSASTMRSNSDGEVYAGKGFRLFLAKLDANTNVEWFESVRVPADVLIRNAIPATELAMVTMGVLIWRNTLYRSRLLCLVNRLSDDNSIGLEALKRATNKFKCVHHVLTIGARRASAASTASYVSSHSSGYGGGSTTSTYRSSISSNSSAEGMKLRVMMCQSRSEMAELPSQAVRETKFLLAPNSNPLLCLCFPLT